MPTSTTDGKWGGWTGVESVGIYLPPRTESTRDVLRGCHHRILFPMEQVTGIRSRHTAGDSEFSIDLAKRAAERCFAMSRYEPSEIDLLICCNISRVDGPDCAFTFEPSTALRLRKHFGMNRAEVFDISNGCAGMFTAIYLIHILLKAQAIESGMVISGEYITHLARSAQKEIETQLDPRMASLTLGDAGAALILEASTNSQSGFEAIDLYTLSRYASLCVAKLSDRPENGGVMLTDSIKLSTVTVKHAVQHTLNFLQDTGCPPTSVQHFIPHQTSRLSLKSGAREMNKCLGHEVCHEGNLVDNLSGCGNTATTTHFVALWNRILDDKVRTGDRVLFSFAGSGLTIGNALYTVDDLPNRVRDPAKHRPFLTRSQHNCDTSMRQPCNRRRVRIESIGFAPGHNPPVRDVVTMGTEAVMDCLSRSTHNRRDLELVLYCGVYRNQFISEPAIAALIAEQADLNADVLPNSEKRTLALDLSNGALGFLNSCKIATEMIRVGRYATAMVIAAEVENNAVTNPSKLLNLRETASAVILDAADGNTGFQDFGFEYFTDYSDSFMTHIGVRNGAGYLEIRGREDLEGHLLNCIPVAVQRLLHRHQRKISDIKAFLPPQVSFSFVQKLARHMGVSEHQMVSVPPGCDDLFTSSLVFAMHYAQQQRLFDTGDTGIVIAAGSGVQVGCASYVF